MNIKEKIENELQTLVLQRQLEDTYSDINPLSRMRGLTNWLIGIFKGTSLPDDIFKECCLTYEDNIKDFQNGSGILLYKTLKVNGNYRCMSVQLDTDTYQITLSRYQLDDTGWYPSKKRLRVSVISYTKLKKLLVKAIVDSKINEIKEEKNNIKLEIEKQYRKQKLEAQLNSEVVEQLFKHTKNS